MFSLNLDANFDPTNYHAIPHEIIKFGAGEVHPKLSTNYGNTTVVVTTRIKNSDDIMTLLLMKNALKNAGVKAQELIMPYIPYGRADRKCDEGEAFSLKVFADLLNSANFNKVTVFDAHSDVSLALINNIVNISNAEYVLKAYNDFTKAVNSNEIYMVSPDSGANKKANKVAVETGCFSKIIKCDKIRDVKTGNLSGFEVFTDDLEGKHCLIVDDICDGGFTFTGIAQELVKKNSGKIGLFISHGIFSKGFHDLMSVFERIYTTNSFSDVGKFYTHYDEKFVQFKLKM
jgi:ribose-phosphate pyrophosphokinase